MEYSLRIGFTGSEIAEEGKEESNDESNEGKAAEAVGVSNESKNDAEGLVAEGEFEAKASKAVVVAGE
jgi:hypothetical protein